MFLYGYVKGLRFVESEPKWTSSQLRADYMGECREVGIRHDNVSNMLLAFLHQRSQTTDECLPDNKKVSYRIISLAELKLKYYNEKAFINDKKHSGNVPYVRYRFCDELKEIIKQIDMIVELGKMNNQEIFMSFFLV